jgi:hypothetical protein
VLRKEFTFKKEIIQKAKNYLETSNLSGRILCSVHIRRGDYKNLENYHGLLDNDYYEPACNLVLKNFSNVKFLIFSDETEECKKLFKEEPFFVVDSGDDAVDLCVMSMCQAHVIANSSYSWWGAWLSKSKAVIAPKKWFGHEGPKNWDTVYQEGWVLI